MTFAEDLAHSKRIEQLYRTHPKFPFLTFWDLVDENVLLRMFWLYMVKPYIKEFGATDWQPRHRQYDSFRFYGSDGITNVSDVVLEVYSEQTKRLLSIAPICLIDDKPHENHFMVNCDKDNFLAEQTENSSNMLHMLAMGVDLRHPEAIGKAREFMHAFFIEKLPLEEMIKKMEHFDKTEGYKFKRDSDYAKNAIKNGQVQHKNLQAQAIAASHALGGEPCPTTGMWYSKGISTEQGIYFRQGDILPSKSFENTEPTPAIWKLLKVI